MSAVHLNGVTPVDGNGIAPRVGGPSTLSTAQYPFCQSTIRTLKKLKDAAPFLRPVNPISLNTPHYPLVIESSMDSSTVERKLASLLQSDET
jgi:bromodomain-containing factor 1